MSPDGRTLTATFTGAPHPAGEPCGADYTATAVESPHAVVVIVGEHFARVDQACSSVGAERTATLSLAAPLAGRAVLEVRQGDVGARQEGTRTLTGERTSAG